MKKAIFLTMIIAASVVILAAFFMPWANVATSVTGVSQELLGAVSKAPLAGKVVGDLDKITGAIGSMGDVEIKTVVHGNKIPAMVNNKSSKVALSLAQILFKSAEGLDVKSYLVYLAPILGIACALFGFFGLKNRLYIILLVVISGVIAIVGLYNLNTMDLSSTIVKIAIGKGLWYTMYAFLFMSFVGIAWIALDRPWAGKNA
ncbi:hypothetical protein ACFL5Y_01195 [Candidatus Omnitrophota bacterium]